MKQLAIVFSPCDPNVNPLAVERLKGQKRRVYEALLQGPCTNADFIEMRIFRYSARIFELRHNSKIPIKMTENGRTGLTVYELEKR